MMHTPDKREREYPAGLYEAIRGYEDAKAPAELLPGILNGLKPRRLSLWQRLLRLMREPVTVSFTPARGIATVAVLAVALMSLQLVWYGAEAPVAERTSILLAERAVAVPDAAHGTVPVRFVLADELRRNHSVAVIGSFNQWQDGGYSMRYDTAAKVWVLDLMLPRGEYEYVFLVDGRMTIPDPGISLVREDNFGSRNSVLYVGDETREI
jgi:hypothetical protein